MALILILIGVVLAFVVAIFFSLNKIRNIRTDPVSVPTPPISATPPQVKVAQQNTVEKPVVVHTDTKKPIPTPSLYRDKRDYDSDSRMRPYPIEMPPGPYPGVPLGIPVPAGALKMTAGLTDYGGLSTAGGIFPYQQRPLVPADFFRPYEAANGPFVGSVDAYAPFPSVSTPWEKSGILTSTSGHKNEILNLYRRPIAPAQELWEYQVQDKDGFIIRLDRTKYLQDGDEIHHIIGKHGMGPWKVHMFVQNRYVWV